MRVGPDNLEGLFELHLCVQFAAPDCSYCRTNKVLTHWWGWEDSVDKNNCSAKKNLIGYTGLNPTSLLPRVFPHIFSVQTHYKRINFI